MKNIKDLLLNKKIVAIKGFIVDNRKKHDIPVGYILFDDGETYLQFDSYINSQDGNPTNNINIKVEDYGWKNIMNAEFYGDSTKSVFF